MWHGRLILLSQIVKLAKIKIRLHKYVHFVTLHENKKTLIINPYYLDKRWAFPRKFKDGWRLRSSLIMWSLAIWV